METITSTDLMKKIESFRHAVRDMMLRIELVSFDVESTRRHQVANRQQSIQILKDLETTATMRGRVERLLMPILHKGEANMDAVAEKLGVNRQALYRALKDENVTFEQVLDDLRHRLALEYLRGRKTTVNETAYLVGFSDPASFSRAFKRWTGKNPSEMRD